MLVLSTENVSVLTPKYNNNNQVSLILNIKTFITISLMLNIHTEIKDKLNYFCSIHKIPNILFHGPSGSGKRTIVNNFVSNIYNNDKEKIKTFVMYVNCAHGKGIKFIREDLKFFAKTHINSNGGDNFKSIILLNADKLTMDAQSALRRCIELFSHNTRFFIVVENKERLLNPILSRFCEIYVSDGKINPTSESTTLSDMYGLNMYQEIIQSSPKQPHILVKYAIQWCEDGWCVYDWMNCLSCDAESNTPILSTERLELLYLIRMCYYKIKPDFRCEKMLMFYLLYFTLISSKEDLKNMLL